MGIVNPAQLTVWVVRNLSRWTSDGAARSAREFFCNSLGATAQSALNEPIYYLIIPRTAHEKKQPRSGCLLLSAEAQHLAHLRGEVYLAHEVPKAERSERGPLLCDTVEALDHDPRAQAERYRLNPAAAVAPKICYQHEVEAPLDEAVDHEPLPLGAVALQAIVVAVGGSPWIAILNQPS